LSVIYIDKICEKVISELMDGILLQKL